MLPSQLAQLQSETRNAVDDEERPAEERGVPRVLWDKTLSVETRLEPVGMALCVAAATQADLEAFVAESPYLKAGVFDSVRTFRWTQVASSGPSPFAFAFRRRLLISLRPAPRDHHRLCRPPTRCRRLAAATSHAAATAL